MTTALICYSALITILLYKSKRKYRQALRLVDELVDYSNMIDRIRRENDEPARSISSDGNGGNDSDCILESEIAAARAWAKN